MQAVEEVSSLIGYESIAHVGGVITSLVYLDP
jgi:hypothetical protein